MAKITLESLAGTVEKLVVGVEDLKVGLEKLVIITQNGFMAMQTQFDNSREEMHGQIAEIKSRLDAGDIAHLESRVTRLEKKAGLK